MSADNYLYVRKLVTGNWSVTEESASADVPGPSRYGDPIYSTWKDASIAAQEMLGRFYVEYGIHSDPAE